MNLVNNFGAYIIYLCLYISCSDRGLTYIVSEKKVSESQHTLQVQIGQVYFRFTRRMYVLEIHCGRLWVFKAVEVLVCVVLGYDSV
jgi:hypothetical protein